jgi:hypothetical protein
MARMKPRLSFHIWRAVDRLVRRYYLVAATALYWRAFAEVMVDLAKG